MSDQLQDTKEVKEAIDQLLTKMGTMASASDAKEIKERVEQAQKDMVSAQERVQYLEKKIEDLEASNGKLESALADYSTKPVEKKEFDLDGYKNEFHDILTKESNINNKIKGDVVTLNCKAYVDTFCKNMPSTQKELLVKRLHEDVLAAGGNLIPTDVLNEVQLKQADFINPIRKYARIISTTSNMVEINTRDRNTGATWGKAAPTASSSAPFGRVQINIHDLLAVFVASENLVMDSGTNIENMIMEDALIDHNTTEAYSFLLGDGVGQPRGILMFDTYSATTVKTYYDNKLGYHETATASTIDADDLVAFRNKLPAMYRPGSIFVMNSGVLTTVETLKDGAEQYILRQEFLKEGSAGRILGYPIEVMEDMPAATDGLYPIMFGNLGMAYTIVDRIGMYVQRDATTNWPDIHWKTKKRVGGHPHCFQAVRLLKVKSA